MFHPLPTYKHFYNILVFGTYASSSSVRELKFSTKPLLEDSSPSPSPPPPPPPPLKPMLAIL